jgi:hypothetical protein
LGQDLNTASRASSGAPRGNLQAREDFALISKDLDFIKLRLAR